MLEIDPQHYSLDDLLTKRLFRIPQYQRAYSWERKQRSDLFEDINRSFRADDGRKHFMATIVGLRRDMKTIITDEHQVIEIVDGQQRITTLVLLLKAISKALDPSDAIERRVRTDIEEILVKPDSASLLLLQTNHDTSNFFRNYILNAQSESIQSAKTLADRELLAAIGECESFVQQWAKDGNSLTDLVGHLKNRLTFIFHEISDESAVYSVFEVLNSRGLAVSWFDRLKSMLMSVVFDSDSGNNQELIDEIHSTWSNIYRAVGLRLGVSTESLRFAATLRAESRPSKPLNAEDAVSTLLVQSQTAAEAIETSDWLLAVTESVDRLHADRRRSAVTQIAHARLVAVALNLRDDIADEDKQKILSRWEKVTFRIYGIYGKDARSAVGDYVRLAWDIENRGLSAERIMSAISSIGKPYPSTERTVADELGGVNVYGERLSLGELRYFFNRYEEHLAREAGQNFDNEQWNRIWEANAADSIEHILPQRADVEHIHWLGNLTLLPPKLNSKLQDRGPKVKAQAYRKTGLLVAEDAARRVRTKGRWSKQKILRREREMLRWAAREWAG